MASLILSLFLFFYCLVMISIIGLLYKIKIKKLGYWLLGGYVVLLLCSVLIYSFLSIDEPPVEAKSEDEEVEIDLLNELVYAGVPIDRYEQYKIEDWVFDVSALEQLIINVEDPDNNGIEIVIEMMDEGTRLEAGYYQINPTVIDMEAIIVNSAVLDLMMEIDTLNVKVPDPSYYEYTKVTKEFPFTQFENSDSQDDLFDNVRMGDRLIYLKVPENLELQIDPHVYYKFIE